MTNRGIQEERPGGLKKAYLPTYLPVRSEAERSEAEASNRSEQERKFKTKRKE